MMYRYKALSDFSILLSVLIAITSANPWFVWHIGVLKLALLGLFIIVRTYLSSRFIPSKYLGPLFSCVILFVYLYSLQAPTVSDAFTTLLTRLMPLCLFILFDDYEKARFLKLLTNILAIVLLISLVFFVAFHANLPLTYSRISNADSFYNEFYNYYAFIIPGHTGLFTRFQSVFTEPGHLGMIIALLFYIIGYNFRKWQAWVLLIALLWTFSVAAYILFFIGFVIYKFCYSKKKLQSVIILSLLSVTMVGLSILHYKSNPDSLISTMILERLQLDEGKGLSGNNRNTIQFMQYYEKFLNSNEVYLGLGTEKYQSLNFISGNSSYRCFVMEYGVVGLFLLAIFYISCIIPKRSILYWGLFILYCFSFWQRPYALWEIESFLFIAFSTTIINKTLIGNENSDCFSYSSFI